MTLGAMFEPFKVTLVKRGAAAMYFKDLSVTATFCPNVQFT